MKRWLLRGLVVLVIVYCIFLGLMFAAMRKSPTEFSRFMMKLPRPLMYATPFPPMWNKARAGSVNVGDLAPDRNCGNQLARSSGEGMPGTEHGAAEVVRHPRAQVPRLPG